MAQVYSVNMVGYINQAIPTGYTMIANQLNASPDNRVTTLIPAPPNNTAVYKFNPATGGYDSVTYITGIGWDDGGAGSINMTLSPGEGAFIFAETAFNNTFVGEVALSSTVPLVQGYSIISSALPQSLPLDAAPPAGLGLPVAGGDQVYQFNRATGGYVFDEFITGLGWSGDSGGPPVPDIGESFFFNRTTAAAGSWNRTFTVGP
jgi:hypothetical protein